MSIGTKVQFRLLLQLIYDSLLKHASKVVGSFSYSRKYLTPVMLYLYKCHTKNGVLLQYLGWSRLILIIHYAVSFSRIHHRLLLSLTRKVWQHRLLLSLLRKVCYQIATITIYMANVHRSSTSSNLYAISMELDHPHYFCI